MGTVVGAVVGVPFMRTATMIGASTPWDTLTDGTTTFRREIRDGYLCLDKTLTALGFGTGCIEDTDWENVKSIAVSWIAITASQNLLDLDRNTDLVEAGGYPAMSSVASFNGATSSRYFLLARHDYIIRQKGNIEKLRVYTGTLTNCTNLYFQIWRKDGTTYDRVAQADIKSLCTASTENLITLASPIAVEVGDFIGFGIVHSGSVNGILRGTNSGSYLYYVDDTTPGAADYDWEAQSSTSGAVSFKVYMQAPLIIGIGDSIMAGHNGNSSYIEQPGYATEDIEYGIMGQLADIDSKAVYQNMGIGGEDLSEEIVARFTTDVVNLKPRIVVINGGLNDIAHSVSEATYLAAISTILSSCVTNDIVVMFLQITPYGGTTAQLQKRDSLNAQAKVLVEASSKAKFINLDTLGQNRAIGDPGNLWDLKTIYKDPDDTHLIKLGYGKVAERLYLGIYPDWIVESRLLSANAVSSTQIDLTWIGEDATSIERSTDGVTYTEIDTVAAGVVTYSDTGLAVDTYYYRVRAFIGSNYSAYSNISNETITVTCSYANPGGSGDRTASVTVTSSLTTTGTISTQVNGNTTENAFYWGVEAVSGKYIRFDFGAAASKIIQEVKFYQSTAANNGTWIWQGSNNGVDWTNIGTSFTFGGATTTTMTSMSANTTGYRYYQLLGVSGNTSDASYDREFEFKIADA